jgi:hypothetical protein
MNTPSLSKDKYVKANEYYFGKGQPLDCQVYTPNGWANIGDLKINDSILTRDGSFTNVIAIYPQGITPVYELVLSDGRATRCCINHLWKLYHPEWNKFHTQPTSFLISLESDELAKFSIDLFNPEMDRFYKTIRKLVSHRDVVESFTDDYENILAAQKMIWSLGGIANVSKLDNEAVIHYAFTDETGNELKINLESVSYVGEQHSQCIKVAHRDYLYITDNYIITHNGIEHEHD